MSERRGPNARRLRFAAFEFEVRSGELRKAGMRVRLTGQPLRILELLVTRPGELVTREELRRDLWTGDTFVDFEHNLNSAVKRLRAALGDSAETPRFIETLPRRGYRFLVPVEVVESDAPLETSPVQPSPEPVLTLPSWPLPTVHPPPGTRTRRRVFWIGGGLVVLMIVTGFPLWRIAQSRASSIAPAPIVSLAVLPFDNLSDDPEQEYFADGMTDALITSLAQRTSLKVISRTSVMAYKNVERPVSQIAKELSVDAIVEGSVLRAGAEVRITAQLIHPPTDHHLWAKSYDVKLSDVLQLQSDVARAIAHEVNASLSPSDDARPARVDRVSPAVHELYLRGRYLIARRTEPELRRALGYFQEAAAEAPDYALAHVGVAQVWDALSSWPGYIAPKDGYPYARAAALKALALDDSLAEAHTALASVHELHDWDLDSAERRYQRAIALNPNYALAYTRYSLLLARTGRPDAALQSAQRARALDPLAIDANTALSLRLLGVNRIKEALAQMLVAVELDRHYFDTYVHLADIYQRVGSISEAIDAAERAIQLSNRHPHAVHGLAIVHLRQGQPEKVRPLIQELEAYKGQSNPYDIATLYLQLKEYASALTWLKRACDSRTPAMAFLHIAQEGSGFDPIRADPRFAEILRCVGKPAPR